MLKSSILSASLLLLASCAHPSNAQGDGTGKTSHWLVGCWQHVDGDTQESWVAGFDDLFFGHAVTVTDGQLRAFEDLRIQPSPQGGIVYVASPNGSPPVAFQGVENSETMLAFEKADHDYPQRIQYERPPAGLTATISLIDGSNAMSFDMTRCAAQ